jgi:hypothetical protein
MVEDLNSQRAALFGDPNDTTLIPQWVDAIVDNVSPEELLVIPIDDRIWISRGGILLCPI